MKNFRVRKVDAPIGKDHVNHFVPQHVVIGCEQDAEVWLPIRRACIGAIRELLCHEEVEEVEAAAPHPEGQESLEDVSKALPLDDRLLLALIVRALASISTHGPGTAAISASFRCSIPKTPLLIGIFVASHRSMNATGPGKSMQ